MGTAFPLLSYGENAHILLKMHFAVQKDVFLTLKYGKTRWRPGLRPGPRWGSLRRSPRPPSRLGRGHPSPDPTALSSSILAPSALYTHSAPSAPRISRLRRSILAFPLLLIYEMTTDTLPSNLRQTHKPPANACIFGHVTKMAATQFDTPLSKTPCCTQTSPSLTGSYCRLKFTL